MRFAEEWALAPYSLRLRSLLVVMTRQTQPMTVRQLEALSLLFHQVSGRLAGVPVPVERGEMDPERYHRPPDEVLELEKLELLRHYGLA